jgi:hypothetical protein
MSDNMNTECLSCSPRAQGATPTENASSREDVEQETTVQELFDQGLEEVKFNNIKLPINVAYDRAVAYVEAGKGNWRRTGVCGAACTQPLEMLSAWNVARS